MALNNELKIQNSFTFEISSCGTEYSSCTTLDKTEYILNGKGGGFYYGIAEYNEMGTAFGKTLAKYLGMGINDIKQVISEIYPNMYIHEEEESNSIDDDTTSDEEELRISKTKNRKKLSTKKPVIQPTVKPPAVKKHPPQISPAMERLKLAQKKVQSSNSLSASRRSSQRSSISSRNLSFVSLEGSKPEVNTQHFDFECSPSIVELIFAEPPPTEDPIGRRNTFMRSFALPLHVTSKVSRFCSFNQTSSSSNSSATPSSSRPSSATSRKSTRPQSATSLYSPRTSINSRNPIMVENNIPSVFLVNRGVNQASIATKYMKSVIDTPDFPKKIDSKLFKWVS